MTILEAVAQIGSRRVSSVELVQTALGRIKRMEKLNAFVTVMETDALDEARRRDEELARGQIRGPLHGVPVAVKDLFCTKGVRTTDGSKLFENYVPDHDAAVVERLRAAGAVLVGKTGQHELAYGITSNNPHFGAVRNPWNPAHIPGGSSGGSGAAVGAGMVPMAMGSDTGGSIRIPASFCGTAGIKPTIGRVSKYGAFPLGYTLDTMGPLAASVRDCAVTLQVLAGRDERDETSSRAPVPDYLPGPDVSIRGMRIGIPEQYFYEVLDPEVESAVRAAARKAEESGATLVPVLVPDMEAITTLGRLILMAEVAAGMTPYLHRRGDFGADVLALIDQGRLISAADYVNAQRLRRIYQKEFSKVWEKADCLLAPATPSTAPRIGQTEVDLGGVKENVRLATTRLMRGINVLGVPALSVPCGLSSQKMPIGLQLIGRPFGEATLFRAGAAIEDAIGSFRLSADPA